MCASRFGITVRSPPPERFTMSWSISNPNAPRDPSKPVEAGDPRTLGYGTDQGRWLAETMKKSANNNNPFRAFPAGTRASVPPSAVSAHMASQQPPAAAYSRSPAQYAAAEISHPYTPPPAQSPVNYAPVSHAPVSHAPTSTVSYTQQSPAPAFNAGAASKPVVVLCAVPPRCSARPTPIDTAASTLNASPVGTPYATASLPRPAARPPSLGDGYDVSVASTPPLSFAQPPPQPSFAAVPPLCSARPTPIDTAASTLNASPVGTPYATAAASLPPVLKLSSAVSLTVPAAQLSYAAPPPQPSYVCAAPPSQSLTLRAPAFTPGASPAKPVPIPTTLPPPTPSYAAPPLQPSYAVAPPPQPSYAAPAPQPSYAAPPLQSSSFAALPPQPSFAAVPAPQPSYAAVPALQPSYAAAPPPQPSYAAVPAKPLDPGDPRTLAYGTDKGRWLQEQVRAQSASGATPNPFSARAARPSY